jgi:hypothetical protein
MNFAIDDLPAERQQVIARRRAEDPAYQVRAHEKMFGLERYFCTSFWAFIALGITPSCNRWESHRKRWFSGQETPWFLTGLHRARWTLALLESIEPFAPSPAQAGWWTVCRHFRVSKKAHHPTFLLWQSGYPGPSVHLDDIVELAYDDFLDGSRLHRAVTPTLNIPRRRYLQTLYCPWYLLNLPDHPTMAEEQAIVERAHKQEAGPHPTGDRPAAAS